MFGFRCSGAAPRNSGSPTLMLETFDRLRQRAMVNGGSTCPFPLQRRDLADAAGLSRVHVARTLESLRERRLAEIQNGTLVIFDRPRLTDLAGYVPLGDSGGQKSTTVTAPDISAAISRSIGPELPKVRAISSSRLVNRNGLAKKGKGCSEHVSM